MLDFSRQYDEIRLEVLAAIEAVCLSQKFILGPQVTSFEHVAAKACGVPHAIGCASGTDALWLAMAAAGIGPGDAVITSPFSFFASVSAILRCGATPLLADINPATFNLSPAAVLSVLNSRVGKTAKAILPVHLYGQCADMTVFRSFKQRHKLLLIEDAAQAFGAAWNGTPAGALGDAAAFSFYPTKNLSAFGDAGLVTTTSTEIDEHSRSLRGHGMKRRYYHDEVGWNSRLDSIQAAVLEVKLRHLPRWNQQRRDLAARYDQLFIAACLTPKLGGPSFPASSERVGCLPVPSKELSAPKPSSVKDGLVLPYTDPRAHHIFHQYVIRAPRRDALRQYLTDRQIGSEIYYPLPLHLQTSLAHLGYTKGDFPESERAAAEVLALPMYPELREDEQQTVVEAIRTFYA
jgi:dTDP-4-amino-4,6-dideoxygalactose transaminase